MLSIYILTAMQTQVFDYQASDFVREAGMAVNPSALTINGRRLGLPRIQYGSGPEVRRSFSEYT